MRLPSSSLLPAGWVWPRVVISLLAGSLVARTAGESSPPQLSEAIRQTRHIIAKDASKVPGLAVTVSFEGKIVWSEGFGYADLDTKRPVSPSTTRFRIASVSKPLTAAGLMRLVERGKVDLDAPVQHYVLDFPLKKEGAITTRLLAGHLAGIRNYKSMVARFPNAPALKQSIMSHHTSAEDAGRIAREAGVKLLVLSHLVPPDDPTISDQMWVDAAHSQFSGPVIAGKDLLEL